MSKKKTGIIVAVVVIIIIAAAAVGAWFLFGRGGAAANNGDKVYVESVAALSNINSGAQNRYSGVVEPQESWEIKKNPEKTVKEVFVQEGDEVEVGTPLFEYETEDVENQIAQAKLELEGIGNEIADYNNQITELQAERNTVSEDEKFQYTTQIQSIQTSIKQAEYNRESKKVEISKLEESVNNAVVTSEIAGIIKSISESGYDQYTGEELPFMTVLAVGDYRVKGTINEQNVWTITPGAPVLLRSRIDEEQTWTGTITEVDTNTQITNNNSMYYGESSAETATKYPFYIALDNAEGLILGQHIYIEMDMGQTETKEGIWLYESYIVTEEDGSTYVWADNGKNRLEKRTVELGEYDENMGMQQITSGLTEEDYIAYPMEALYEGVTTVTDANEVDYSSPMYMQESEEGMMDDGMMDEGMMDEGMMDESMMDEGMTEEEMLEEGIIEEDLTDGGEVVDEDMTQGQEAEPEVSE